jgi:hypothetical protein
MLFCSLIILKLQGRISKIFKKAINYDQNELSLMAVIITNTTFEGCEAPLGIPVIIENACFVIRCIACMNAAVE